MANGIKLRRGLKTSLLGTLAEGELVFATDSKEIGYKQDTIEHFVSLVDINTIKAAVDHSTTGLSAAHTKANTTKTAVEHSTTGLAAAHTKADATKSAVEHSTTGLAAAHTKANTIKTAVEHSTTGLAAAHTKIDTLMPPNPYGLISFKILNNINLLGGTYFYIPIGEAVGGLDDCVVPILLEGSFVAKQANNSIYSTPVASKMLLLVAGGYGIEASGVDFIVNNSIIYLKLTAPANLASELCINMSVAFNSPLDGYGNAMLKVPSSLDPVTSL